MPRLVLTLALLGSLVLPSLAVAQGAGPIIRTAVMQSAATATGNGTVLDVSQASTATVAMIGGSAVVTIEASNDGVRWTTLPCYPIGNATVASTFTFTTTQLISRCNVTGLAQIRARISTYTSGSITIHGIATSLPFAAANGF